MSICASITTRNCTYVQVDSSSLASLTVDEILPHTAWVTEGRILPQFPALRENTFPLLWRTAGIVYTKMTYTPRVGSDEPWGLSSKSMGGVSISLAVPFVRRFRGDFDETLPDQTTREAFVDWVFESVLDCGC